MQSFEPTTLRDVAAAAGVSVSTASRALGEARGLRPDTVARVRRAARRLNYRPNSVARQLKTGSSRLVGLVVHNLVNATFHTLAEVAQQRLGAAGYQVLLAISQDDRDQEARILETLATHRVDGVVVVPTGENRDLLTGIQRSGVPVVALIREPPSPDVDTVLAADDDGAYQATRHLLDLGHRRIGLIAGRPDATSGRERARGYVRALTDAGLTPRDELIVRGGFTPSTGSDAVGRLLALDPPPTALLVANHEAAFGALPALVERGVDVPRRLSVICYEDVPWFPWWHPPMTAVDNGAAEISEVAVNLLLRQIEERQAGRAAPVPRRYQVQARMLLRGSCEAATGG